MPVLRAKYPRFDRGRCYPKFSSWGEITRSTLWEGARRRSPEGAPMPCDAQNPGHGRASSRTTSESHVTCGHQNSHSKVSVPWVVPRGRSPGRPPGSCDAQSDAHQNPEQGRDRQTRTDNIPRLLRQGTYTIERCTDSGEIKQEITHGSNQEITNGSKQEITVGNKEEITNRIQQEVTNQRGITNGNKQMTNKIQQEITDVIQHEITNGTHVDLICDTYPEITRTHSEITSHRKGITECINPEITECINYGITECNRPEITECSNPGITGTSTGITSHRKGITESSNPGITGTSMAITSHRKEITEHSNHRVTSNSKITDYSSVEITGITDYGGTKEINNKITCATQRKEITINGITGAITGAITVLKTRRKSFIPKVAQRGSGSTATANNNNNINSKKGANSHNNSRNSRNNSRNSKSNSRSNSNSPKSDGQDRGLPLDGQNALGGGGVGGVGGGGGGGGVGGGGQRNNNGSSSSSSSNGAKRGLKFGSRNGGDQAKSRTPNLNVPGSRTRSGSRSSGGGGGSSPAGLHGRAPHKTAVVAPAPSRPTPKNSLNRFGFRNSSQAKSGDSTDSVNSILSDAQTCSDSNSNIFDLCDEENENRKSTNGNGGVVVGDSLAHGDDDDNAFVRARRRLLDSVDSPKVVAPTATTTTPSRASNVVLPRQPTTPNNSALSSRITAHTRQLPKPQVVTVKPVSPKVPSTPVCNSPSIQNSPLSNAASSRTKSPSIRSLFHTPLKTPSVGDHQHLNTALRTPRESRDSESSSTRSAAELDSGLGSSSESDRIRGGEGETETPPADSRCNADSAEDASDAWLKKTRQQQQQQHQQLSSSSKKSRGSMEIQFNGTSSFEIKRQSLESKEKTPSTESKASPLAGLRGTQSSLDRKSESGGSSRDKRGDSTITYGMARQKFAPYSRSRYGYGYQTSQNRSSGLSSTASPASGNNSSTTTGTGSSTSGGGGSSSGSPGPSVTKIPGSSGLVKSRVAMIETPQHVRKTNVQQTPTVLRRSNLKKPIVRPTSLEKTPILVMPVTEKTVELSKPVCRKLEYSENTIATPKKNEAQRGLDQMWENELTQEGKDLILHQVTQPVEDILIVGSVEVETHKDSNVVLEADHHGSFYENGYDKGLSSLERGDKAFEIAFKGSINNCVGERKAYRDTAEKEKREKAVFVEVSVCGSQVTDDCMESGKRSAETPDDSGIKLLSPQSESSFEILESLSETVDLTTEDEGRKSTTVDLITEEEDLESTAASADTRATETDTTEDGMAPVSPETKIESSVDSAFSSEQTTVTSVEGDTVEAKPPPAMKAAPTAPSLVPKSSECILNSGGTPRSDRDQQDSPTNKDQEENESGEVTQPPLHQPPDAKKPPGGLPPLSRLSSIDLRNVMESSMESHKSASAMSILTDSGEHSNHSGKCTPTLNTGRSDLDQDFLIDDEIADQPGLMFGGSNLVSSFFTDDGLFNDLGTSPPPPSHSQLKQVMSGSNRSRANSVDTTSSVGADDLMLDYFDLEEVKAGGSSVSSGVSLPAAGPTGTRPKKMHLRISIPGRRYDEEVLSPDANEIFSEWTAMMAEVSGAAATERCVSRDGSTTSSGGGGGSGGGRTSRPRLSSSSADLSAETRRPTVLRPPRQGGLTEMDGGSVGPCGTPTGVGGGGGVFVDRTAYHYMCQDVTSLKTMLLRLRRVLQVADTINPFDVNLRNSLYLSLAGSDSTVTSPGGINGEKDSGAPSLNELSQENVDLRRQVVLLQQQLQERDRTIRLLQQQLAQNLEQQQQQQQTVGSTPSSTESSVSSAEAASVNSSNSGCGMVNAATQTERSSRPTTLRGSSLSRTGSTDDGFGPTVSSEVTPASREGSDDLPWESRRNPE
ncbi:serine-rich adhesin for platelets isoform X4 [Macrobrachium rosenbergii]|uniref:serine-rich adhesin for platelets isoform X4 n=1 Tax=Macrobrachium rosenbergii TaxID=79674 RepID=UPI0034D75D57